MMFHSQINPLLFPENLRLPDNKIIWIPTGIGNIIRDPSGAVGNVPCTLQDDNVQIRLVSLRATGRTHARRISPDDHESHFLPPTSRQSLSTSKDPAILVYFDHKRQHFCLRELVFFDYGDSQSALITKILVTFKSVCMDPFLFTMPLFAAMAIFLKGISIALGAGG
jgi:hypothetical protein